LAGCLKIHGARAWWPPIELDEQLVDPGCVEIEKGKPKDPDSILPEYIQPLETPQGTCWWYVSVRFGANTDGLLTLVHTTGFL